MATSDEVRAGVGEDDPGLCLGVAAVARRLGVAPSTLRTWDRRYRLGPSSHLAGSHRRYGAADQERLAVMRRLILDGVQPAEAARIAMSDPGVRAIHRPRSTVTDQMALMTKLALVFLDARLPVGDVWVLADLPRQRPAPRLVLGGPGWGERWPRGAARLVGSLTEAVEATLSAVRS